MKSRLLPLLFAMLLLSTASIAQNKVTLYRTSSGKLYTAIQKDSIKALGFPVAMADDVTVGDTTFISFEILPKENAFVLKHKNKPLPAFSLKTLDGKILTSESLKGKVVMINIWSTTCGPCLLEMPQLNQLKEQHKDVVFLAPAPENAASIKKLLSKHAFNFIILPDAKQLFADWGIDAYPKNFFIDKSGVIREVKEGTPILNERDAKGQYQVAVMQQYSPILDNLTKEK